MLPELQESAAEPITQNKEAMEIDKRNRMELKSYFVRNSIPTEKNFIDLIDGMLNQKDDGIVKLPGEPLSLQAAGDQTSLKKVINFFDDFATAKPSWTLSLNPRTDPGDQGTAKPGWNLGDGDGKNRLFIDRNTGYLGVGTITPKALLDVGGFVQIGEKRCGSRIISFSKDSEDDENAGTIVHRADWDKTALSITGAGKKPDRKIFLYDDVSIFGKLRIVSEKAADMVCADMTTTGEGQSHFVARNSSGTTTLLRIAGGSAAASFNALVLANDARITFAGATGAQDTGGLVLGPWTAKSRGIRIDGKTGNVGIGTSDPKNTLQVEGNLHMNGNSIFLRKGPTDQYDVIKWIEASDQIGIGGLKGVHLGYTEGSPNAVKPVLLLDKDGVRISDGSLTVGSNPIRFASQWSGFPDEKDKLNQAEISNDTDRFKTLMIVGNRSASLKKTDGKTDIRRVSVWDRLEVHGELVQELTLIGCLNSTDWKLSNQGNHPIRQYFKRILTKQPEGTLVQGIADHADYKNRVWIGYVDKSSHVKIGWVELKELITDDPYAQH